MPVCTIGWIRSVDPPFHMASMFVLGDEQLVADFLFELCDMGDDSDQSVTIRHLL